MARLRVKKDALRTATRGFKARMKNPTPIGRDMAREMRFGEGGLAQQFARRQEFPLSGGTRAWWAPRRDWSRPGERRGQYEDAWLGRSANARETAHKGGVTIGINPKGKPRMWRVNMLQSRTPTRIDMRRRKNRRKMQFKLGMLYGLWATQVTLHPRPVSVNPKMLASVGDIYTRYVAGTR